jgi:catechol 2,3-dioxygenase-like lactoylglutathione lyase family enzyme
MKGEQMSRIELRPLHCGISVSNLAQAVEWFERVLGFEFVREEDMGHLGFRIAFVRSGDFFIELFEHSESRPAPPESKIPDEDVRTQGTKHICFQVDDLDSLVDHFKAQDVHLAMGPLAAAGLNVVFVHGPDGVLIEFAEIARDG